MNGINNEGEAGIDPGKQPLNPIAPQEIPIADTQEPIVEPTPVSPQGTDSQQLSTYPPISEDEFFNQDVDNSHFINNNFANVTKLQNSLTT